MRDVVIYFDVRKCKLGVEYDREMLLGFIDDLFSIADISKADDLGRATASSLISSNAASRGDPEEAENQLEFMLLIRRLGRWFLSNYPSTGLAPGKFCPSCLPR